MLKITKHFMKKLSQCKKCGVYFKYLTKMAKTRVKLCSNCHKRKTRKYFTFIEEKNIQNL